MATKITRACPECRASFDVGKRPSQLFCCTAHQVRHNNRQLKRGQAIVSLAMAWRAARGSKSPAVREASRECFGAMCRKIDRMLTEDREHQRMSMLDVIRFRIAHWLIDLG